MNRRILLSLIFICSFIISTRAQISKGSVWLGGSIGYNQNKIDKETFNDEKGKTFTFAPGIGKAIKENLIAGIQLGYKYSTFNSFNSYGEYNSTQKSYSAGVFIRPYIPIVNRLYIFGDASAGFNIIREKTNELYNQVKPASEAKGWSAGMGITPGISYGINKKIQLETGFNNLFHVGYARTKSTSSSSGNYTFDNFTAGISAENKSTFYIGIRFLLNNKVNN